MNSTLMLVAVCAFSAGLSAAFLRRPLLLAFVFNVVGLLCATAVFVNRYLEALPMMPMHLGIIGIICVVAILWCCSLSADRNFGRSGESIIVQLCLITLTGAAILFPKDFYLPFIRSFSIWAHLFFLLGVVAKGLLLYGGLLPLAFFIEKKAGLPGFKERLSVPMKLIIWGYGVLAFSMFCGEIWSYLGWGTPVVWHDAAITTIIALWFYWTCFLHLHYMRSWTAERRALFMVVGGFLVLVLGAHPDMGPFRMVQF